MHNNMLFVQPEELTHITNSDDNALRLARIVTGNVLRHTRLWVYDANKTGLPVNEKLREAFHDAAMAQAEALNAAGLVDEVVVGGATSAPVVTASSSNGKSVSFDNTVGVGARTALLEGRLCPEAVAVLIVHGGPRLPGVVV